jgi:hypothetical protein
MVAAMSDQAMTTTEPVLFESNGGRFQGKLRMFMGRFELTASRIVFYQRSIWWQMFGLIGALLGRRSAGKRVLDIELATIASLARGKFGLNKKILDITRTDGSEVRIAIDKYDAFTARLREELGKRGRLVEAGDERWQVGAA